MPPPADAVAGHDRDRRMQDLLDKMDALAEKLEAPRPGPDVSPKALVAQIRAEQNPLRLQRMFSSLSARKDPEFLPVAQEFLERPGDPAMRLAAASALAADGQPAAIAALRQAIAAEQDPALRLDLKVHLLQYAAPCAGALVVGSIAAEPEDPEAEADDPGGQKAGAGSTLDLRLGDLVVACDGRGVGNLMDLLPPTGQGEVTLQVLRDDAMLNLKVPAAALTEEALARFVTCSVAPHGSAEATHVLSPPSTSEAPVAPPVAQSDF